MKKYEVTALKMAMLIKQKFPQMEYKQCGKLAKELYINSLRKINESSGRL